VFGHNGGYAIITNDPGTHYDLWTRYNYVYS